MNEPKRQRPPQVYQTYEGDSGGHRLPKILADSVIKSFFSKDVLVAIGANND